MAEEIRLSSLSGDLALRNQTFREDVAAKVLSLFRVSVIVTGLLTVALAAVDATMIWQGVIEPEQRLISERVLLALIGATILELGAALGTIVFTLFKRPKPKNGISEDPATDADTE